MNRYGTGDNLPQSDMRRYQLSIPAQLYKAATNMRSIDELFSWLAQAMTQSFNAQAAEIWGRQIKVTGQLSAQLRTLLCQDRSLPRYVVANSQVAVLVDRVFSEQGGYLLQSVDGIFSNHQATLLARYGLNYCYSYFLKSNTLLPPAQDAQATDTQSIPTALAVLLFFGYPPPQNNLSAINLILDQAVVVAESRGLLLPLASSTTSGRLPVPPSQSLTLADLIPHTIEDDELLKSSNPLSGSIVIADKQARRFYAALDGRKSVNELCGIIGIDMDEARRVLLILLAQHRVELYEPGGKAINSSLFLNER